MGKEAWFAFILIALAGSIGLLAISRTLGNKPTGRIAGIAGCLLLAYAGYCTGKMIPFVGNWVSFLFVASAGLGLLIVATGSGKASKNPE